MHTIEAMASALRLREVSCRELAQESLRRIERLNPELNAFITVTGDLALNQAAEFDEELARGQDRGLLHGIPVAHKDLMRTKGVLTTAGSRLLADYVPKRDAEIVARLAHAGAVSAGKTGLHEFAYGITSNNPHFGAIRNPWDPTRIAGGSSGGSAAAVASGMVPLATGTDTGGSIRVPASFCGIVGLKPTFGRVSTRGVLPLGYSQDHVGPMTLTVRDAAIAFQRMIPDAGSSIPDRGVTLAGIRIGLPRNYFFEYVDADVARCIESAAGKAADLRATIIEIDVPDMHALRAAAATCLLVEAVDALRHYLDRRDEIGADVLALLDQGRSIPGAEYVAAMRTRKRIGRQFAKLWDQIDVIFTPATPIVAPPIGEAEVRIQGRAEEVRAAATRFTRVFNALGIPAISIPCGLSGGLPVGLQVVAGANQEDMLLAVAAAMEDALGFLGNRPKHTARL